MSIYRRFNLVFLTLTLFPVLSIGLFNIAVDPYGVINSPTFPGINKSKIEYPTHDRLFKAIEIIRLKPTIVFLGSSTTQFGLDASNIRFGSNTTAYNLGLQNASIYELKRYFQHARANQPKLKTIVVGLDLFMFKSSKKNNPTFKEERLEKTNISLPDFLDSIFSLNALNSSIKTLKTNLNAPTSPNVFINGMLRVDEKGPIPGSLKRFTQFLGLRRTSDHFSEERLTQLKEIVDTCKQRGIDIKLFISPSHAMQGEGSRTAGSWSEFEQWKRELVKIAPVWDFSGYNSITTEPVSNDMRNYYDSMHYRKEVGDLVLNRMFSYREETVPADFGVLITPDNIESHLDKIHADREAWAKKNPEVVKLVQDLKRKLKENK